MSNAFLGAAISGDLPATKLMLAEDPERITEVDERGSNALLLSAEHGRLETVRWCLDEGVASIGDVDNHGSTALICAAESGQLETVKWLLQEDGASIGDVAKTDAQLCSLLLYLASSQPHSICWNTKVPTLGIRFAMATRSGHYSRIT
jgi:ankyrin repeat protein